MEGANRWNVEPYAARAAAYLRCARYDEALADCKAGLALKPGDPALLEVRKRATEKQQGALENFPP